MKKSSVFTVLVLGLAASALAQTPASPKPQAPVYVAPTKVGIINMGQAIASTKEGQKAMTEIGNKYAPRQAEYEKRKQELDALTAQLNNGRATMSDAAQKKLSDDIQSKTTALTRFREDAQSDMDNDDNKMSADLEGKMRALIQQFAIQNGYAVILNYGDQQSPVLWAANANIITEDMVKLYDQVHPVKEEAPTKPAPAPVTKKQ